MGWIPIVLAVPTFLQRVVGWLNLEDGYVVCAAEAPMWSEHMGIDTSAGHAGTYLASSLSEK